ncbi:MAG: iron ABC transporter permease [Candidatus Altiarchaeota archaeon]|nr:iron ABC transporter permease [Candidatus Altiarchaeota archaeon]
MALSRNSIKHLVLLLFIVLTLTPPALVIVLDFSIDSYRSVFFNPRQLTIFFRTVELGLGVSLFSLLLGCVVAFLLECTDMPFNRFFNIATIVPLLIPPYISVIGWMVLLGKKGDWINISLPINIYNIETAVVLLSLSFFPMISIIVSYALRNADYRLEEAARQVLSPIAAFRKATIPLVLPHIVISTLFVFLLSISEYGVPSLLQVHVFMTEIFAEFSAFFNMGNSVALSIPLLALILFIIFLINHKVKDKSYVTISSFTRSRRTIRLTQTQKILGIAYLSTLVLVSAVIPLMILFYMSHAKFGQAWETAWDSVINSFWLAALSATILSGIAFIVAYFHRRLTDPLVLSPLAVPSAIIGLGLIKMWNHSQTNFIYATPAIILLGVLARFLPFVIKTYSPFFEQMHESVERAARQSGASFHKMLWKITMPLMRRSYIPVWAIAFILSLRELEVTLLVTPPGFQTLPNRIYTLLHYGDYELVSALCIMVVVLIVLPLVSIILLENVIKWRISKSRD